MMIEAVDAESLALVQMNNPDFERDTRIRSYDGTLNKLWERHTDICVGTNHFKYVFKSTIQHMLVWYYHRTKVWVVLNGYDEDKEDTDKAYADKIDDLMSKPASAYQIDTNKDVVDIRSLTKQRGTKRTKVVPDDSPSASVAESVPFPANTVSNADSAVASVPFPANTASNADSAAASVPFPTNTVSNADSAAASVPADSPFKIPAVVSLPVPAALPVPVVAGALSAAADLSAPLSAASAQTEASSHSTQDIEKQNLADALQQAQDELAKRNARMAELETEVGVEKERASEFERLHKNYKQRKGQDIGKAHRENKMLKAENERLLQEKAAFDAAFQVERDAAQQRFDSQQKVLQALKSGQKDPNSRDVGENVVGAYKELIELAFAAYDTKAQTLSASTLSASTTAPTDTFYVLDQSNQWFQITDSSILRGLSALYGKDDRFTYKVGQHNYEARLADGKWIGQCDIVQKNITSLTERKIRVSTSAASTSNAPLDGSLTNAQKHDILFGDSPVTFTTHFIESILQKFSFDDPDCYYQPSLELAKLADLFNSFSNNFKYVNGKKHKTDVYIKPIALYNWLMLAKARKYTSMRIVMHGAGADCYDGVRDDPFGMDLKYAGMNGQAFGNGFYFGLSDHVTLGYNKVGKAGTALMGLCLTNSSIKTSYNRDNHGGYRTFDSTRQIPYTTFQLSAPTDGRPNCIVVHEGALVLILGKVVTL
tara:strand:+ start:537 stop:2678 length:2142 start_codon:yes stop_codon:yes gene_type:complete